LSRDLRQWGSELCRHQGKNVLGRRNSKVMRQDWAKHAWHVKENKMSPMLKRSGRGSGVRSKAT
jgi:hypothetical protein